MRWDMKNRVVRIVLIGILLSINTPIATADTDPFQVLQVVEKFPEQEYPARQECLKQIFMPRALTCLTPAQLVLVEE